MHAYHRSVSPLAGATTAGKTHSYVPVINIPRQDFALRTGAVLHRTRGNNTTHTHHRTQHDATRDTHAGC